MHDSRPNCKNPLKNILAQVEMGMGLLLGHHKMAAKSALVSGNLVFAVAGASSRSYFRSSHRSFQRLKRVSTRHYSALSGQRHRVALPSSACRPTEATVGRKAYSSTQKDQGGEGSSSNREKTRVESSGAPKEQHGSVIMQFVESKGQPKELTTARKGMCAGRCLARVHQFCLF